MEEANLIEADDVQCKRSMARLYDEIALALGDSCAPTALTEFALSDADVVAIYQRAVELGVPAGRDSEFQQRYDRVKHDYIPDQDYGRIFIPTKVIVLFVQ